MTIDQTKSQSPALKMSKKSIIHVHLIAVGISVTGHSLDRFVARAILKLVVPKSDILCINEK